MSDIIIKPDNEPAVKRHKRRALVSLLGADVLLIEARSVYSEPTVQSCVAHGRHPGQRLPRLARTRETGRVGEVVAEGAAIRVK
jgi:hypothetical protein